MSKIFNTSHESNDHQISPIEKFSDIASPNICHSSYCFILIVDIGTRRSKDRLELGFMNRVKINGIPTFNPPLILTVTIVDRNLTEFLVDDKSSSNILYADTMDMLGIQQTNMNSYSGRDLLAFNDSITCRQ